MIGQTLSDYRIIEKIGPEGMGEVYSTTDSKLGSHMGALVTVDFEAAPGVSLRDPR